MSVTITCTELVDLLLEFTGGDLDDAQRAVFEQHLCGCATCIVTVETYQATIVVTRALSAVGRRVAAGVRSATAGRAGSRGVPVTAGTAAVTCRGSRR